MTETIEPMAAQIDQQQLAKELVEKARAEGVELVGPPRLHGTECSFCALRPAKSQTHAGAHSGGYTRGVPEQTHCAAQRA